METKNKNDKEKRKTVGTPGGLFLRKGGTTFVINLHYSETSMETLNDKIKRLIEKEVEEGRFL